MSLEVYTELLNTIDQQSKTIAQLVKELEEKENLINELMRSGD